MLLLVQTSVRRRLARSNTSRLCENDARYGGAHSPDLGMFMPVYHNGERICWVACSYHQGENGAREPGGMGPGMESPWDEGFKGSPMRLVENYQLAKNASGTFL